MLARALAKPSNVLVLDEPTNDLDLETLDVLEEMVGDYAGTVLLISHDRDFLDRVVNAVIVPEGGGRFVEYAGGYSDMLAQRGEDLSRAPGKAAARGEDLARAPGKAATRMDARDVAAPPSELKPGKRRLSFHEKHALETLPKTIAALQAELRALHQRLDDPGFYARDRKAFDETSAALAGAQTELAAAEEKWLALEMLREKIEDG
jgi:ATP-binding cassette subfamily F protein uup